MIKPPPIYLIQNGEISPSRDVDSLLDMLEEGEVKESCLACIEGMKQWRSVKEVLVWAQAVAIPPGDQTICSLVQRLANGEISPPTVRLESAKQPWCIDPQLVQSVVQTNADLYRAAEQQVNNLNENVLDGFPAMELIKVYKTLQFPRDWKSDWERAGGKIYSGRMIARKDDPVWMAMSDFGFPFAPFSFELGMWTEDVDRGEATKLGLITRDARISPIQRREYRFAGHFN